MTWLTIDRAGSERKPAKRNEDRGWSILIGTVVSILLLGIGLFHTARLVSRFGFRTGNSESTLFDPKELTKYNGVDSKKIYVAVLGSVFDVTPGVRYYGTSTPCEATPFHGTRGQTVAAPLLCITVCTYVRY